MALQPQHRAVSLHHHLRRLLILLLIFASTATQASTTMETSASPPSAIESPATASAAATFLRDRCATTLYPALCYDSLLPYADTFQTSYVRLAAVAANVTGTRLCSLAARIKDLVGHGSVSDAGGGGRPSETSALRDCESTISDAANLAKQSSAELSRLDGANETATAAGGSSSQRRWAVSNAKTWLSAAMTNEGTCADGLEEAGAEETPAGKEVNDGVASVKQYTSNALALVNGIPL
ncbi:hypothetical protein ACP70R_033126 [Stipagrostis hirtigluma subsp. patula]